MINRNEFWHESVYGGYFLSPTFAIPLSQRDDDIIVFFYVMCYVIYQ